MRHRRRPLVLVCRAADLALRCAARPKHTLAVDVDRTAQPVPKRPEEDDQNEAEAGKFDE